VIIATLLAALPPLYDAIIELRALGGYIETFVLMLFVLISVFRLTQRWREGGSPRELALRWFGIGFIVGLGLWVNPLIISAVLAAAIWIVGSCLQTIWPRRKLDQISTEQDASKGTRGASKLSTIAISSITAVPACIIGFAPALYWGATNSWRNMSYIVNNGGGVSSQHLSTIDKVAHLYTSCIVKRIIGGALPDVNITATFPRLFTLSLAVSVLILFATVLTYLLSFFWHPPFLLQIRQLVSLPLLFGVCTAFIFCISKISAVGLFVNCNNVDYAGRYATPLLLALPFLFAASFTYISIYLHEKGKEPLQERMSKKIPTQTQSSHIVFRLSLPQVMQAGLYAVLFLLLCGQGVTYAQTNAGYTFQTSGCVAAPAKNDPIIEYMQHEHIRYAWGSFWIGNPIIFKTQEHIIIADPRIITTPRFFKSRIPAYTTAVVYADRPSVLTLVSDSDSHPQLLRKLDTEHIVYHVARFPSEPGIDLLVVTPISHDISPFESNSLGAGLYGC
jgi:hypothetical protein